MDEIYSKISDDRDFGIEFDKSERSDIQEFFSDEVIFFTGCTGFLGKCFVEKLLRSCSRMNKLYLMMRPWKDPVPERTNKYFGDEIFARLHDEVPNFKSKVFFIEGNLKNEDLAICPDEYNTIINEVTMIIHNASNVKFNAKVNELLRTNVCGTENVLNFAKKCKNLKIFTYVSTAYSHSHRKHIEERCYPPPGDLKFIKSVIKTDESTPGIFTEEKKEELIKPWPNLYTFSKASAESLVEACAKDVPFRCLIYRPAVVISTYNEPVPGWVSNLNGPVAAILALGLGQMRTAYKSYQPMDMIPADMSINALLTMMWDSVANRPEKNTVLVYNYGSSIVKPISMRQLGGFIVPRYLEIPSKKQVRPYYVRQTACKYYFILLNILLQVIPAMIGDVYLLISRFQRPTLTLFAVRISKQIKQLYFFVNGNWKIYVNNAVKMWDRMSEIDKHLFYNDLRTLDWEDYCYHYWGGVKHFILKEPGDEEERYRRRREMRMKIYWVAITILYITGAMLTWYYLNSLILLMLSPFINLARLSCSVLS